MEPEQNGFHGYISMLSMLAWDRKSARIIPHESMESIGYKTIENIGGMGICKNGNMESIGSMVFSSILLSIIPGKHAKEWECMEFMQMNLYPSGSLVVAGFPGLY